MTLVEAQAVAEGIVERIKEEFDQNVEIQRVLTYYIGNSFQKGAKPLSQVYPKLSEKENKNKADVRTKIKYLNAALIDFRKK